MKGQAKFSNGSVIRRACIQTSVATSYLDQTQFDVVISSTIILLHIFVLTGERPLLCIALNLPKSISELKDLVGKKEYNNLNETYQELILTKL